MYPKHIKKVRGRTLLLGAVFAASLSFGACAGDQREKDSPEAPVAIQLKTPEVTGALDEGAGGESDPGSPLDLQRNTGATEDVVAAVVPPLVVMNVAAVVAEEVYVAPAAAPLGQSGVLTELDNALSNTRWISNPTPWNRGRVGRYKTSLDREADRAKSLAARAELRSFEGAPPVMPHSSSYTAGSKTCLDCHMEGIQIGKKVAHPMPHVTMANCTQCHVEQENRLFDELLVPGNNFSGDRPERKGISSMAGAPPVIPHGTLMRTACLSCHGEFGYAGLKTDHPSRSNCMQCHIVER